jgi:pilus assembly protein Flp/PilA
MSISPTRKENQNLEERTMLNRIMNLVKDEQGATALEYGLIAALIAAFIVGAVTALGTSVRDTFQGVADDMAGAGSAG